MESIGTKEKTMANNKYEELSKLKQLLDSGILNQEEFEREKTKILESGDSVIGSSGEFAKTDSLSKYKWQGIALATILVGGIAILSIKSSNDGNLASYTESDTLIYAPDVPLTIEEFPEETEIDLESVNLWSKHYFKDKWGDEDHNRPYITTWIGGDKINLGVLYCDNRFTLKLFDDDGDVRDIYSSKVNLSFRYRGDEINSETPLDVVQNEIHIGGLEDLEFLSTLFNSGAFQICLEYDSYNEHYHYVWNVNHAPGAFVYAVENILGSTYQGN